jgi:hypothetical protein
MRPGEEGLPVGARGNQAGLVGEHNELRPVAGTELDHRAADVGLGGGGAEHHGGGDLVVGQAVRDKGHHLSFPVGEAFHSGRGDRVRWTGYEFADQAAGDRGGQQRIPAHDRGSPDPPVPCRTAHRRPAGDAAGVNHVAA